MLRFVKVRSVTCAVLRASVAAPPLISRASLPCAGNRTSAASLSETVAVHQNEVTGATVTISSTGQHFPKTFTDALGRFSFTHLPASEPARIPSQGEA